MRMKILVLAALTLAAFATLGFSCINEGFIISVNLEGITGKFKINPGDGSFNDSITVAASTYLDVGYENLSNFRVYDVRVSTIGNYSGDVDGTASVNGEDVLHFNGKFSYFNTPRSILNDPSIEWFSDGMSEITRAITARKNVTIKGVGNATPAPLPDGQYVYVEIFAQVDAEP